ncbi:hypothetical protein GMO_11060 [Gluconobacter morbifer G707]|uniref:Uncharacterized protein n=2 Tax=Gluconobacter TaxID=441 RepID=G6XHW2_9PROT|nr:hypothetical protein GMO_11060 [Gluconobacter morbifer G707]
MGAGSKAHARPAITDYEASKLTLDALTATPVYHRPVIHRYFASRAHSSSRHMIASNAHHAVVRNVSYRTHVAVIHRHAHARRT